MIVSLNALGIVNPLGRGKAEVAQNLFAGWRGGLDQHRDLIGGGAARVGTAKGELVAVPDRLRALDCRNNRLALAALQEIEVEIAAAVKTFGTDRIAVVMGTSTSGVAEGEQALARRLSEGAWPGNFTVQQQEIGSLAGFIADYLGLQGPAYTIATACSSSAKVFASGSRLIEAGLCDAAIVGGADTLCGISLNGFASLEALAKDYCNPFSRNRDGINIGEGAAVFLMSRRPSEVALLGVGECSDAYHVSAPHPEGRGAKLAMRLALEAAGIEAPALDYVNLHGTATPLNDAMEGRAVAALLGSEVPCSSTKSLTGHMLGAAGANEAAFLWLSLAAAFGNGTLPPHLWDGAADPDIPPLNLIPVGTRMRHRPRAAMLSNSFAFGGSNAAVILGRGWT